VYINIRSIAGSSGLVLSDQLVQWASVLHIGRVYTHSEISIH